MLAAGRCSARRRGRTLGLPADWTLRSRDTGGLTRCPFRLGGALRPDLDLQRRDRQSVRENLAVEEGQPLPDRRLRSSDRHCRLRVVPVLEAHACSRAAEAPAECRFARRLSGKGAVTSGCVGSLSGMGARFIGGDRDQVFLMPPLVTDWVPGDHLVWTVLEAVGELDLWAFYADYRADGPGRPAYEPSMMVALLLYAYARGNRSARGIERACVEDVAYRVVAGNVAPDHSTIADSAAATSGRWRNLSGVLGSAPGRGWRRWGWWRSTARRCRPTRRSTPTATSDRSPGRSSKRPRTSIGARTSSTARSAATSCPSTCAHARGGARRSRGQGTPRPRARPGDPANRR